MHFSDSQLYHIKKKLDFKSQHFDIRSNFLPSGPDPVQTNIWMFFTISLFWFIMTVISMSLLNGCHVKATHEEANMHLAGKSNHSENSLIFLSYILYWWSCQRSEKTIKVTCWIFICFSGFTCAGLPEAQSECMNVNLKKTEPTLCNWKIWF